MGNDIILKVCTIIFSKFVANQHVVDRDKIYQWIIELSNPETREQALLELSKKREVVPDLAPMLWHSFGTMAALLQARLVFFGNHDLFLYGTIEEHLRS